MIKIKTLLLLSSMSIATALQAQPTLMPAGGNLNVVQNDTGNATTSVTVTLPTQINNFNLTPGSNKGDFNIHVGPTARNNFLNGIFISAVSQNGRDNSLLPNLGGNGTASGSTGATPAGDGIIYGTPAIENSTTNMFIPVHNAGNGQEFNVNLAAIYLPYSVDGQQGFLGGHTSTSLTLGGSQVNGGTTIAASSSFSPGIALGTQFIEPVTPNGTFTLNLNGVTGAHPTNAAANGVLLVVGGKNEDNYAMGQANVDGSFSLFVRDNGSNGVANSHEQDAIAFAYIPAGTTGLTAGRVTGTAAPTAVSTASSGTFSVAAAGTGQVLLTIPGVTGPNDGVLVVTAEGGESTNLDNIVNYQWDTVNSGFIVQSRDIIDGATVPALQNVGTQGMFSFAYMPLPKVSNTNSTTDFGRFLGARVAAAETLVGLASSTSTLTSGAGGAPLLQTTASLLAGTNATGPAAMVEISWRTRTTDEASGAINPALVSDVARVTGLDGEVFTLQMNYNQAFLNSLDVNQESSTAANGLLHLAWRNGSNNWVNAITGNSTVGSSALFNQQLSWADFVTANPLAATNLGDYLGSWGVDQTNNQAWAVLNHNSDFAVIPEPTTMVFAGIGLTLLAIRRIRRKIAIATT